MGDHWKASYSAWEAERKVEKRKKQKADYTDEQKQALFKNNIVQTFNTHVRVARHVLIKTPDAYYERYNGIWKAPDWHTNWDENHEYTLVVDGVEEARAAGLSFITVDSSSAQRTRIV